MAKKKIGLDVLYDEPDNEEDFLRRSNIAMLLKAYQRIFLFEQKWDLDSDFAKVPTICRSIILDFIAAREFIREMLLTTRSEKLDLTAKRNVISDASESALSEMKRLASEFKKGLEYLIYQVDLDPGSCYESAEYESVDQAFERDLKKKAKEGITVPEDLRDNLFYSEEHLQSLLPYCHYTIYALPPIAPKDFKFEYSTPQKVGFQSHLIIDLNEKVFIFNGARVPADEKKIKALANLKKMTGHSPNREVQSKEVSDIDLSRLFTSGFSSKSASFQIFENHVRRRKIGSNVWYRIKGTVVIHPEE